MNIDINRWTYVLYFIMESVCWENSMWLSDLYILSDHVRYCFEISLNDSARMIGYHKMTNLSNRAKWLHDQICEILSTKLLTYYDYYRYNILKKQRNRNKGTKNEPKWQPSLTCAKLISVKPYSNLLNSQFISLRRFFQFILNSTGSACGMKVDNMPGCG